MEKKCDCGAWNEDVCICKNSYIISNPLIEDYSQPTVKVQKASVNLPEDRCKQCELEGNNGVCDRKDCKNFPVPNGVQETNNTNAIKDSVERYAKNLPWNAPVAEAIVFGVQEPWEEEIKRNGENWIQEDKLIPFIKALLQSKEKQTLKNIGMLRQWLNEDRITDPHKMVSNEDLQYWLSLTNE